jgi:NADPH-dependent curcumin reductase CurA
MRRIILKARPGATPLVGDFAIEEAPTPDPGANQLLVQTLFMSIDPYVRLSLDEMTIGDVPGLPLGQSPIGRAVARVVKSNHADFTPGDLIEGRSAWAEYAVVNPAVKPTKLDLGALPLSYAVGALGMPGQTAYAGMIDIGHVQPGETVVISAAAGAVGSMAGQIGKILGARVVGLAGGAVKCAAVEALGFDLCLDYKAPDFDKRLAAALPQGFQVYFENVGGDLSLKVIAYAAYGARMPLCGLIANYGQASETGPDRLPHFLRTAFVKGIGIKAFHGESVGGAHALAANRTWIEQGKLKPAESIIDGFERIPEAFEGTFRGNSHIGKVVVRIAA